MIFPHPYWIDKSSNYSDARDIHIYMILFHLSYYLVI